MFKIFKRLSPLKTTMAIIFLLIQIASILYLPSITADIVNKGIMLGEVSYVWSKGLFMLAVSVCGLLGAVLNTLLFSKLSYTLGGQLRSEIYRKAMQFSPYEFEKIGTSSLITRNTNDVTQVQTLIEMTLKFLLMAPLMLIGGIVMTFLINPTLALIFLATLPLLMIAYFIIYHFANPLYATMQKLLDKLNLSFREGLTGVRIIRAFRKDKDEYEKYQAVSRKYAKTSIMAGTIMGFFIPLITLLIGLATLGITWFAGIGIQNSTMQVGDIMACMGYASQILMAVIMVTAVIATIFRGQASAKRIYEIFDMPLSITNLQIEEKPHGKNLAFDQVSFRNEKAEQEALPYISFNIGDGQTLAIIGSTGSGKTTLVNLILRQYDAESGFVFIGGTKVHQISSETLHNLVSVSPQKSTLFFGTIRSNMLLANPQATDTEIWQTLDVAQASKFVQSLDKGLDSAVEKDGANFSGGQRQRLCIARALLKKAAIYVFDDSFSALDFKTDRAVRTSIKAKLKGAITVIVAQRISTIREADLIAVLDNGVLAGLGTHDELKKSNAVYQEIIASQFYREGRAA